MAFYLQRFDSCYCCQKLALWIAYSDVTKRDDARLPKAITAVVDCSRALSHEERRIKSHRRRSHAHWNHNFENGVGANSRWKMLSHAHRPWEPSPRSLLDQRVHNWALWWRMARVLQRLQLSSWISGSSFLRKSRESVSRRESDSDGAQRSPMDHKREKWHRQVSWSHAIIPSKHLFVFHQNAQPPFHDTVSVSQTFRRRRHLREA